VSFRISPRVHARAGIQGIQKRIWIHALRVRSGTVFLNGWRRHKSTAACPWHRAKSSV